MHRYIIFLFLLCFLCDVSICQAQEFQALNPLVRPKQGKGSYSVELALRYAPTVYKDNDDILVKNNTNLSINLVYNLTSKLSVFGSWSVDKDIYQKVISGEVSSSNDVNINPIDFGLQYEFSGKYAPLISIDFRRLM